MYIFYCVSIHDLLLVKEDVEEFTYLGSELETYILHVIDARHHKDQQSYPSFCNAKTHMEIHWT